MPFAWCREAALFVTKCGNRREARSLDGWVQPEGDARDEGHDEGNSHGGYRKNKNVRIEKLVNDRCDQGCQTRSGQESGKARNNGEQDRLDEELEKNVPALGAERFAKAYFARPFR